MMLMRKKSLCITFVIAFLLTLFATSPDVIARGEETSAQAQIGSSTIYVVTAKSGLRLRKKPNASAPVITTMKKGTQVKKVASNKEWWKVKTKDGKVGYCHYLYLDKKISDGISRPHGKWYINSSKMVDVRQKPSNSAKRIGRAKKGVIVTLLNHNGVWGSVQNKNGSKGYIQLKYLSKY